MSNASEGTPVKRIELYWFEFLGLGLIAFGIVLGLGGGVLIPEPLRTTSGVMGSSRDLWTLFLKIMSVPVMFMGLLLCCIRALLAWRLWHSWILMIPNSIAVFAVREKYCYWCCPGISTKNDLCGFFGTCVPIDLFLLGITFFFVQLQHRNRMSSRKGSA